MVVWHAVMIPFTMLGVLVIAFALNKACSPGKNCGDHNGEISCTRDSKCQWGNNGCEEEEKIKGGGKAQLRAMRDAIRQYEAQSGERQLGARRTFNRAKRQLAVRASILQNEA